MKKLILSLVAFFCLALSASAMDYEDARQQALFLTDKMAYELNLTDDQYEAAYEINLDYLMSINNYDDLYGLYWRQRNRDLEYILAATQWNAYLNSLYFYRPLYWDAGCWHFRIYARYPVRDYYFFGEPSFCFVYRGGHSWRMNGGRSWYAGRSWGPRPGDHGRYMGMRDGFDRGNYGRGWNAGNPQNNRTFGNLRTFGGPSSTRTTVNRNFNNNVNVNTNVNSNRSFGNRNFGGNNSRFNNSGRSFGGSHSDVPSRVFTPSESSRSNSFGGHSNSFGGSNNSFGGSRSYSAPSRSFGGGNNGGSFGGGHSGSFGGGHSGGFSGGGSFGGHR
ncbi:MAG: hypothetical protein PUF37_05930 [Prevotellaceae bacterium]|nr:hypothetical protein [Prevotellaceae bacterium]